KTVQFYTTYINFINYYYLLNRSIRTGDFEIFKYVLPKIANLFFVLNQPNYARWLVKYHDNLLKIGETHPEISEAMKKGYLGIQRTDKSFSRHPIDLTLEQTINAEAVKRLVGI
ncbi:GSCOCG00012135001-RA-CDS, partial [Cotesia congregata]